MNPGDLIAGRFTVERFAARGGMGEVYRAHDLRGDAPAAVKVMRAGDAAAMERFARESRLLMQLHHPGIVRYLEHGRSEGGELYLAMEWLEGEDLAERLANSELTVGESLRVATQTAAALAAAHARRIVHRDLKPSNLFLVDWHVERLKVLDFGIARLGGGDRLTETGAVVGTPGYMAPEQLAGAPDIDARVDVFALGAVLFRCLTGRAAFGGESAAEVIAGVLHGQAPRVRELVPHIPEAVDGLVARMLAPDRAQRPRDAGVVLAELMAHSDPIGPTEERRVRLGSSEVRVASLLRCDAPVAERVARAHGAVVETGLAFFAGDLASDLARRAARCALAVRRQAPDAAIALATGRGVVTADGPLALAAAAMLPAGGIRLDAATAGLLDARFEVAGDAAGLVLVGERDADDAPRQVLGHATPFVGRDREVAMLEHVLSECTDERLARPVLVVAPAGMGKSRLRQELVARLRARREPVEVWTGRGDAMRAGAPFALLGDALRRAAGATGGEPLAARQAMLRELCGRTLGAARAQPVAELLGEMAGIPFSDDDNVRLRAARRDPQLLADLTRGAFEELLQGECAEHTLILVLEDLHWGDLPSVRHVDLALRALAERPFMVLGLARPEVHAQFPRLWSERGLQEMHLGPLSRRAAERLVADVLPGVDKQALGRLIDGAAGHAFFLEELMRQCAGEVGSPARQAPETVLAMVASRLEAMEGDARRVLRAAAVLGETFWAGAVRALVGDARLDHWLDLLVEREVVRRGDRSRFPGEPELRFAHALVREAAYGMLTDEDRALGHQVAGAWLERMGETEAVVLAEHYERGRDPARAATWYRRAAEQALAGNDLDAALARAEAGVACGAAGEVLGELRLLQAAAHRHRGDNAAAERASLEAMRLLTAGGAPWSVAAGEAAAASGKLDHAATLRLIVDQLGAAPACARAGGAQAVALARAATQCFAGGETEAGRALLERIDTSGDPGVQAWIEGALSFAEFVACRCERAAAHQHAAVAGFAAAGDVRNACYGALELVWTLCELGAYEELELLVVPAIAEADRLGLHSGAKMARALLARSLAEVGRLDEALALAREAVDRFPELTQPRIVSITRHCLGQVLFLRGDLASAETELRAAVVPGQAGTPYNAASGRLALLRVAQGDPAEALAIARVAESSLDLTRDFVPHEAVVRLALVEALLGLGRVDAGRLALRRAHDALQRILGAIATPRYRQGAAERVAIHRRILSLAAEHLLV